MAFVAAAAAAAGAGASLIGSGLDYKQNKKNAKQQQENREQTLDLIDQTYNRARSEVAPAYNNAQDARQTGLNRNLALTGQTFSPMMENIREGGNMSRDAMLVGRENSRNAVLGNEVDYGALRNQPMTDRSSALTGLTNPEPVNFQAMESAGSTTAADNFTSFDTQSYLAQNPDIAQDYVRLRPALIEGGDPQFATVEGFAKHHYDQYGRQEIEAGLRAPLAPMGTQTNNQPAQAFNDNQIEQILMESQRSPLGGNNVNR